MLINIKQFATKKCAWLCRQTIICLIVSCRTRALVRRCRTRASTRSSTASFPRNPPSTQPRSRCSAPSTGRKWARWRRRRWSCSHWWVKYDLLQSLSASNTSNPPDTISVVCARYDIRCVRQIRYPLCPPGTISLVSARYDIPCVRQIRYPLCPPDTISLVSARYDIPYIRQIRYPLCPPDTISLVSTR